MRMIPKYLFPKSLIAALLAGVTLISPALAETVDITLRGAVAPSVEGRIKLKM